MGEVEVHDDLVQPVSGYTTSIGLRRSKCTPEEWMSYHDGRYGQAVTDGEHSEVVINNTTALTEKLQTESAKRLKERLHDILFWKQELEREINEIIDCRQTELYAEVELIQNVQKLVKNAIEQAEKQISRNRAVKGALEINWSDKKEAEDIDTKAGDLKNCSTNKQFYAGVALYQENMSTVESWAEDANHVITRAEAERFASMDLRSLILNLIVDTSRDMRQQFDRVNAAFQDNLNQLIAAKATLEENLKNVLCEISLMEHNLNELREAIRAKDDPLKITQTRLHLRTFRPNVELCKDPASVSLAEEVNALGQSLDELLHQYSTVENKLKDLHDTQLILEKEIELKAETIHLNQLGCIPRRAYYPSSLRLQGY
ncbi:unnamed protein product [Heterobilharzia americana]|nr:unnamed protein product [Heterobilharzia americana]